MDSDEEESSLTNSSAPPSLLSSPAEEHKTPAYLELSAPQKKKRKKKKRKKKQPNLPIYKALKEGTQLVELHGRQVLVKVVKVAVAAQAPKRFYKLREKPPNVPLKYWNQRYNIFSQYDAGVQLDEESWYSVTHEPIAKHIAQQCSGAAKIMDGFAGAGGNVIQFAAVSPTIAVEIEPERLSMLEANARIYGVADNIDYVTGDFLEQGPRNPVEVLFMSPPWGGPEYLKADIYDVTTMLTPQANVLMKAAAATAPSIILYLPRNIDPMKVISLFEHMPGLSHKLEFQVYFFGSKVKTIGCFFGKMVSFDFCEVATALLRTCGIPRSLPQDVPTAGVKLEEVMKSHDFDGATKLYAQRRRFFSSSKLGVSP
jgi:trimethylguanosine synthase